MLVSDILSTKGANVITVEPNASVANAAQLLAEKHIGALLITGAGGRVTGILSERDIVRAVAARGAAALDSPLSEVMTRKVVTCAAGDTVSVIMERMTTGKFRHIPVVEQDRLVGIISIGDVVKHRVQEIEQESSALRDYIQTA